MSAQEDNDDAQPVFKEGDIVGPWLIRKKLGEGGFGAVYEVLRTEEKDLPNPPTYAMKTEYPDPELLQRSGSSSYLKMDVVVLRLAEVAGLPHFCSHIASGRVDDPRPERVMKFMVMTKIGKDLEHYRQNSPGRHLSVACAISVGIQALTAIEGLHNIGFVHRDLKPTNFAVDLETKRKIILFDFGMCRAFRDSKGRVALPRQRCTAFLGTVRYASISAHISREYSRRDDLESFIYQQIELTNGALPWRMILDRHKVVMKKERARFGAGLKEMMLGCPSEYVDLLRLIDRYGYYSVPNYEMIRLILKRSLTTNRLEETYDWV
ncbi:hypothetical protein L596_024874 [Steinernema carpocapsae]|uniref:Protein kinase domain-containing protein n=1 Tax=Steinernema carpocapsae TaxID=34508 RepID=A0A4V5ZYN5_STECR|nr:hypothetical protein L596_024874 [Steinernema carpocapsae]